MLLELYNTEKILIFLLIMKYQDMTDINSIQGWDGKQMKSHKMAHFNILGRWIIYNNSQDGLSHFDTSWTTVNSSGNSSDVSHMQ